MYLLVRTEGAESIWLADLASSSLIFSIILSLKRFIFFLQYWIVITIYWNYKLESREVKPKRLKTKNKIVIYVWFDLNQFQGIIFS